MVTPATGILPHAVGCPAFEQQTLQLQYPVHTNTTGFDAPFDCIGAIPRGFDSCALPFVVMMLDVSAVRAKNLKVLDPIIGLIMVFVVNIFIPFQWPFQVRFHHHAVLEHPLARADMDVNVAVVAHVFIPARAASRGRTITTLRRTELLRPCACHTLEWLAAVTARDGFKLLRVTRLVAGSVAVFGPLELIVVGEHLARERPVAM